MEERKQLVQAVALSSNLSDRVHRCRSERFPENRCCICPREAEWEKYVRGCQGARSVLRGRLLRQEWLGLQDLAESRQQAVERQKEQKLVLQDIVRVHEVFFGVGNNTFCLWASKRGSTCRHECKPVAEQGAGEISQE